MSLHLLSLFVVHTSQSAFKYFKAFKVCGNYSACWDADIHHSLTLDSNYKCYLTRYFIFLNKVKNVS